LADALKRAFADERENYLIAYTPTNQVTDGRFRQITVRVKDESWSVRTKAGYWAMNELPPAESRTTKATEDRSSALVTLQPPGELTPFDKPPASLVESHGEEAGAGITESNSPKNKGKAFTATIRQVSGDTVIVELADTRFMVLQVTPSTRFSIAQPSQGGARANGPADSQGLRPGLEVLVTGKQTNEHAIVVASMDAAGGSPSSPPAIPASQIVAKQEPRERPPDADETIAKARSTALQFVQALPNFICLQTISRWEQQCGACADWVYQDQLSAEVLYSPNTGETYRNVHVNHAPAESSLADLEGQVSKGEFASTVKSLFAVTNDSDFQLIKETAKERIYSYHVSRARSEWMISRNYQFVLPAYSGRIWIDTVSGRIRRLERQAEDLPKAFPFSRVESEVEYADTRLGDYQRYFLPVKAKSQVCMRDSQICTRNEIDFTRYRRYSGEATIRFQ
jgi:hypothetical protein